MRNLVETITNVGFSQEKLFRFHNFPNYFLLIFPKGFEPKFTRLCNFFQKFVGNVFKIMLICKIYLKKN